VLGERTGEQALLLTFELGFQLLQFRGGVEPAYDGEAVFGEERVTVVDVGGGEQVDRPRERAARGAHDQTVAIDAEPVGDGVTPGGASA